MTNSSNTFLPPAVGVIPAAGLGSRVDPLPGSKEVVPIGTQMLPDRDGPRLRVVSQHLLEALRTAGAEAAYWIIRDGKWDIPGYWGDGHRVGLPCSYLMMRWPFGVPFTIDQAHPFVQDKVVLLGFPDILFRPLDAFARLREELAASEADVVLGCMTVDDPTTVDIVDRTSNGAVRAIHVKPNATSLREAWCLAAWRPTFGEWLHARIAGIVSDPTRRDRVKETERHLGHLFQSAIQEGLSIRGVYFEEGRFLDVGTPEALQEATAASSDRLRFRSPSSSV